MESLLIDALRKVMKIMLLRLCSISSNVVYADAFLSNWLDAKSVGHINVLIVHCFITTKDFVRSQKKNQSVDLAFYHGHLKKEKRAMLRSNKKVLKLY